MRVGIAHHFGWAVAVTAADGHSVVDRRRIELIEPGLPTAPIHHEGGAHPMHTPGEPLSDETLAELVAEVRASARRATASAFDDLTIALAHPITSLSVRAWPPDFPVDIATQRRGPHESRADSVMYCQVLAAVASERGWEVHHYDARSVEGAAAAILGDRAHDVLHGPRATLGPPWAKDHRTALAATILAAEGQSLK